MSPEIDHLENLQLKLPVIQMSHFYHWVKIGLEQKPRTHVYMKKEHCQEGILISIPAEFRQIFQQIAS